MDNSTYPLYLHRYRRPPSSLLWANMPHDSILPLQSNNSSSPKHCLNTLSTTPSLSFHPGPMTGNGEIGREDQSANPIPRSRKKARKSARQMKISRWTHPLRALRHTPTLSPFSMHHECIHLLNPLDPLDHLDQPEPPSHLSPKQVFSTFHHCHKTLRGPAQTHPSASARPSEVMNLDYSSLTTTKRSKCFPSDLLTKVGPKSVAIDLPKSLHVSYLVVKEQGKPSRLPCHASEGPTAGKR